MQTINQDDKDLFRASVENNAPIDKDNILAANNRGKSAIFKAYDCVVEARLSESEVVNYQQNGVSAKIIKKMRQGKINAAPVLDLHGQTVVEACESMSQFIHYHQNATFIQIIHGKGYHSKNKMSILKTQVVSYLKQHPSVLAFNSCPDKNGGTGAVFVLMRRYV